jgi:hypothetical protein
MHRIDSLWLILSIYWIIYANFAVILDFRRKFTFFWNPIRILPKRKNNVNSQKIRSSDPSLKKKTMKFVLIFKKQKLFKKSIHFKESRVNYLMKMTWRSFPWIGGGAWEIRPTKNTKIWKFSCRMWNVKFYCWEGWELVSMWANG